MATIKETSQNDDFDVGDQLTKFNEYVPEQLVAYLYDVLNNKREKYVMDISNICVLSMVLNEQIRRFYISPKKAQPRNCV